VIFLYVYMTLKWGGIMLGVSALVLPYCANANGTMADSQCPQSDVRHKYAPGKPPLFDETEGTNKITVENLYGKMCFDITDKGKTTGSCVAVHDCKGTSYTGLDGKTENLSGEKPPTEPTATPSSSSGSGSTPSSGGSPSTPAESVGGGSTPIAGEEAAPDSSAKPSGTPSANATPSVLDPTPTSEQTPSESAHSRTDAELQQLANPDSVKNTSEQTPNTAAPDAAVHSSPSISQFNALQDSVGLSPDKFTPNDAGGDPQISNQEAVQRGSTFQPPSDTQSENPSGSLCSGAWSCTLSAVKSGYDSVAYAASELFGINPAEAGYARGSLTPSQFAELGSRISAAYANEGFDSRTSNPLTQPDAFNSWTSVAYDEMVKSGLANTKAFPDVETFQAYMLSTRTNETNGVNLNPDAGCSAVGACGPYQVNYRVGTNNDLGSPAAAQDAVQHIQAAAFASMTNADLAAARLGASATPDAIRSLGATLYNVGQYSQTMTPNGYGLSVNANTNAYYNLMYAENPPSVSQIMSVNPRHLSTTGATNIQSFLYLLAGY
jgi:hypothetical protein